MTGAEANPGERNGAEPDAAASTEPAATATGRAADRSGGRAGPEGLVRWVGRLWSQPLTAHAAALAVVVAVFVGVAGTQGTVSADEGAAIAQARLLDDEGRWVDSNPLPALDPGGRGYFLHLAEKAPGGRSPLAKRPLYPSLLAPVHGVAGVPGMVAVSAFGTWLAAVLTALAARRLLGPGQGERAALWLTGVGSPLLFDSVLVIAHTLGAAAVAGAVAVAAPMVRSRRVVWSALAGAAALVGVGALLRSEVVLVGLAAGAVAGGWGLWRRRLDLTVAGAVLGSSVVAARWLEARWVSTVLGGTPAIGGSSAPVAVDDVGFLAGRVRAARITLLDPGYPAGETLGAVLVLLTLLAVLVAAASSARERPDVARPATLVAVSAAVGVVVVGPSLAPGLFAAAPALAALGALALAAGRGLPGPVRFLAAVAGVFALGVLATQYGRGGTTEWGGRYFAVGLPLVIPALVAAGRRQTGRIAAATPRGSHLAIGTLAALVVLSATWAALAARDVHDVAAAGLGRVAAGIEAVDRPWPAPEGERPLVVTTVPALGRLAWELHDDAWFLLVDPSDLPEYLERFEAEGVGQFVLATLDPAAEATVTDRWPIASRHDGDALRVMVVGQP